MVNEEVHQGVEVLWKEVIIVMGPEVSGEGGGKTDGKESLCVLGWEWDRRWVSEWSSVHVRRSSADLPQEAGPGTVVLEAVVPFVGILESTGETWTSAAEWNVTAGWLYKPQAVVMC